MITLLSGTYAYFTASATNNTTISGTIDSLALKLDVVKITTGDELIPLKEECLSEVASNSCVDMYGYTVCQIYKLKLTKQNTLILELLQVFLNLKQMVE